MDALSLWIRASQAEFGISVKGNSLKYLEKLLYDARKDHPELRSIRICLMDDSLWLVKDTVSRLEYARATGRADTEDKP